MKKTLVIIPARKNSKRLKSKNFLKFGEHSLLEHTIKKASKLDKSIYFVVVNSDDDRAFNISKKYEKILFIKRPNSISKDDSTASSYVSHTLKFLSELKFENILILQPTSPFTKICHIHKCISQFNNSKFKSFASVVEIDHDLHPEKFKIIDNSGKIKSFFPIEDNFQRSKMERVYVRNGSIYLTTTKSFLETNNIISEPCGAFIMEKRFSIDINTQTDFDLAELMMKKNNEEK